MEKRRDHMDKYGLLGKHIDYSFSRSYFASKFKQEAIKASYVNFDCATIEEVHAYLENTTISGFNVTIPYKEAVIPLLDTLNADALAIGAVNTIKRTSDGDLIGYNTDYIGFENALLEKFPNIFTGERLKKALILGTGGASKAVWYALEKRGVHCQYVSRKRKENTIIYEDISASVMEETTLIINCTPLGTFPEIEKYPEIPYQYIGSKHILYDLIYNPELTAFLDKGSTQGAAIINGLRMLELQAEAAWDIWNKA